MEKSRIMALADGIFAVAMTLLVLDLKLPEGTNPTTDSEVWHQLIELKHRFLIYTLSFVVLGTYWIGHHFQFHFVRTVDRALLWLNLLFLLFITLLPFSTNLLSDRSNLHVPIIVYGINLLLPSLILLWHLHYLKKNPELAHEVLKSSRVTEIGRRHVLVAFISATSIAISFYKPRLALSVYVLLLALHFLPARSDRYPAAKGH